MADTTTSSVITNAPTDLNLTACYVTADGGDTQTPLIDIKKAADAATAKVTEFEQNSGNPIDTSNFLTIDNINMANGVVGTDSSNNIVLPINSASKIESVVFAGTDKLGNKNSAYLRTIFQYNIGTADLPYQEMVLSYTGQDRYKQIWGSGICPAGVNETDLGRTDKPFKDIYLSNAPTITSDINSKNIITSDISKSDYVKLLDAVFSVSASLYTLKIVEEEKGKEEARIHSGFIAQELEEAVKAEGLDPTKFAFWCNSPVYEETKHEIKDENGNVTSISAYALKVDENGQQVFKQSLRYEELFALLIEAIKVKMAAFEERLTALEAH